MAVELGKRRDNECFLEGALTCLHVSDNVILESRDPVMLISERLCTGLLLR